MKHYNLALIGFGNVGRALTRLLSAKAPELREQYGIEFSINGVASRRLGWQSAANGSFENSKLLNGELGTESVGSENIREWLSKTRPDVVFETTSLNPESGQPAIDYLRAVLEAGAHAVTANKGALVYGYGELSALACTNQKQFLFESAVLDSAPVFSLFRETLPAAKLRSFSGVFNSTTNVILEAMEAGRSFDEGVKAAQELGVAETDPSHDIDGWDATVKVCAIANVLMNIPLKPDDVVREGIRELNSRRVQAARAEGKPFKLIARAKMSGDGRLSATVRPEQIAITEPLGNIRGTSLGIHFELDMMPGLTVTSHRPNLQSTAYGLLADFINAVKG